MPTNVDVIEIVWDGPFELADVISEMNGGTDYGVYQLYGTHAVMGSDSLLYIGKALQRTFSERIADHQRDWTIWEPSNVIAYLGRLGGTAQVPIPDWEEAITRGERLLIYSCSPPYNTQGINELPEMSPTVLVNHKHRHRLPPEVSTFLETADIDDEDWQPFSIE